MDTEERQRVVDQATEVMKYVCAACPKLEHHQLETICCPDRGDHWNIEQEEWAARDVSICEDVRRLQLALEQTSKSHLEKVVKVSKVCMRLFHVTPIELLSPRFGLAYSRGKIGGDLSTGTVPAGPQHPSLIGGPFLDRFYMLMLHPIFAQGMTPDFLVLVLQFTSICRTRDRRRWQVPELRYLHGDDHIDMMRRHLQSATVNGQGELALPPFHVLREMCSRASTSVSVETSLLLRIIDVVVQGEPAGELAGVDEHGAMQYNIYLVDIHSICTALSLLHPPQVSVKEAATIWQQIHPGGKHTGYPVMNTIVRNTTESYKHQKTRELLKSRFGAKKTSQDNSSQPGGAPSLPANTPVFAPTPLPEVSSFGNSPSYDVSGEAPQHDTVEDVEMALSDALELPVENTNEGVIPVVQRVSEDAEKGVIPTLQSLSEDAPPNLAGSSYEVSEQSVWQVYPYKWTKPRTARP
ncbi:unnamed protein product [Clonostachys rosea]|uniref:Uncharacterized protein n=1 Tax=Bionectria ochroleuca TaxID=29856 RepID=A0ABY6TY57_BIOOC|nr:unnamed protein product [Clonostachys rosea]